MYQELWVGCRPQPREQLASCVRILMEQRAKGKKVKTPFALRLEVVLNRTGNFSHNELMRIAVHGTGAL